MEQTSKKKTSKPYSPEFRERAVRLAMEHRDEYQSEAAALTAIAGKLGCSPDSLRVWVRQAQRDGGERPGQTTAEKARIKELERDMADASGRLEYERAALLRDQINELKTGASPSSLPARRKVAYKKPSRKKRG
jgi:transposase-like protein